MIYRLSGVFVCLLNDFVNRVFLLPFVVRRKHELDRFASWWLALGYSFCSIDQVLTLVIGSGGDSGIASSISYIYWLLTRLDMVRQIIALKNPPSLSASKNSSEPFGHFGLIWAVHLRTSVGSDILRFWTVLDAILSNFVYSCLCVPCVWIIEVVFFLLHFVMIMAPPLLFYNLFVVYFSLLLSKRGATLTCCKAKNFLYNKVDLLYDQSRIVCSLEFREWHKSVSRFIVYSSQIKVH